MIRIAGLWGILILLVPSSHAQSTRDTTAVDSSYVSTHVSDLLDERGSVRDQTIRAAEHLTRLAETPLDVNQASTAELTALPYIPPSLAHRIVQTRQDQGPFSSLDELTELEGLTQPELRTLSPYLRLSSATHGGNSDAPYRSPPPIDTMLSNLELRILQRFARDLDPGRGFQSDTSHTTFLGSPARLSTRLRLGYQRRMQLAITLDKDPGEPFRWHPATDTYGFDHISGNVMLQDMGRLETLVIGDFTAQYGQGVSLWDGLSFGKGRDPVSPVVRRGPGIRPFQSTTEDRYFRGGAATVAVTSKLKATGFISHRHRDATLDSTSAESPTADVPAQTLSTGGLHRTPSEITRKSTVELTTTGGALTYQTPTFNLGMTGYKSWFSRPLRPSEQPYRRFAVSGTQASMISLFTSTVLTNYTLFGEVARASTGQLGGIAGASLDHEAGIEAIVLGRRFPRSFPGLYNSAVGESGRTQNETGFYLGLRVQLAERWTIGAYADQYRFPWLRFGVPRPSGGLDTRLLLEYDPRPWLATSLQLRGEKEEQGTETLGPSRRPLGAVQSERRRSVRWQTDYAFSDALTLRTRLQLTEFSIEDGSRKTGLLLYQGVRVQPSESLQFDARVAVFDTDGYDARMYAYEHDLLYSFSVPVLYDRGQRSYILARYAPTPSVTVEAKYGVTWYPHRREIGSGLNATTGNQRRELRVQVRWTMD